MKTRWLRCTALALVAVQGSALSLTIDVPMDCSVPIDSQLQSAMNQTSGGTTVNVLLPAGTCFIQTSHTLNGPASLSFTGAGIGSTVVDINVPGSTAFILGSTIGGIDFRVGSLTFQNALHGVISISDSTLHVDQVRFLSNTGAFGGAISASAAWVTIKRASFEEL